VYSFSKLQTCIQINIYIKVKKQHFIFIIKKNKNKKLKKLKVSQKKLKHEPSLKKPGDFTVAKGHGYSLVSNEGGKNINLSPPLSLNSKRIKK